MSPAQSLALGRDAMRRKAWGEAFRALMAADQEAALDAADLEALAEVAHLLGQTAECHDILARTHQAFLAEGDAPGAARCAFRLGLDLMFSGDRAQSTGWLARANRVLDEAQADCAERGYLLIPQAIMVLGADPGAGLALFRTATEIGQRFKDNDLVTWGLLGQGRALIKSGELARGLVLLDEAMVAVTANEVSDAMVAEVYCSVIDGCYEVFDLRRAHEWTHALNAWCESQPEFQPHRGDCLVRRAEVFQLHGDWPGALASAESVVEQMARQPSMRSVAGAAFYRQAEVHRLLGQFDEAKEFYQRASEAGRQVEPGHALLRLAMGDVAKAWASIRRAADEAKGRNRPPVLMALVEIALSAGDVSAAASAAAELADIAARIPSPYLDAHAAHAAGAVALSEGRAREALVLLRNADDTWRELGAPYESARVRELISQACRIQGDGDAAELELAAARRTLEQLGAKPDLERLEKARHRGTEAQRHRKDDGLSDREREVLVLVAAGRTNRQIADALSISEKTVARHVANIFTKIGVANRAAATSWAYQQGLVRPT